MRVLMIVTAIAAVLCATAVGCGSSDPKLKVTNIEPPRGDATGGTYVHIYGNRFLSDANGNDAPTNAKIYFGGQPGRIVRFPNDSEMIVIAPGGAVGETVDILITFEGRGEITVPKAFTFYQKEDTQMNIDNLTKQQQQKK